MFNKHRLATHVILRQGKDIDCRGLGLHQCPANEWLQQSGSQVRDDDGWRVAMANAMANAMVKGVKGEYRNTPPYDAFEYFWWGFFDNPNGIYLLYRHMDYSIDAAPFQIMLFGTELSKLCLVHFAASGCCRIFGSSILRPKRWWDAIRLAESSRIRAMAWLGLVNLGKFDLDSSLHVIALDVRKELV